MLDLRLPMGLMFSIVGALLVIWGLITNAWKNYYDCSLGINVNLWWGLVLLAFGLAMLGLAWAATRTKSDDNDAKGD